MPYDEKELLIRIANGDEQAFQTLFHLYGPLIRANGMKVLQEENLVSDLVQDVFLRIWLNRDQLPELQQPKAWILQITYYHCFNLLKKQKIQRKAQDGLSLLQPQATEDVTQFEETKRIVSEAVERLPAQAKRIYQLSREEGVKIADIAEQLGLSQQTVKNTLVRALKAIRLHLQERGIFIPVWMLFIDFFMKG